MLKKSYEEERLECQLRCAIAHIHPDEKAKDRMYAKVMQRASSAQVLKKQRTIRQNWWKISSGVGIAALTFAVVSLGGLHQRLVQDTGEQLQVLDTVPQQTSTENVETQPAAMHATEGIMTQTTAAAMDMTDSETISTAQEHGSVSAMANATYTATSVQQVQGQNGGETSCTVVELDKTVTTTAPYQATQPITQTTALKTTETAVAGLQTKPTQTETALVTKETTVQSTVPIRQNIYLYYKLTWNNIKYDTSYEVVSGNVLDQYLGYGVTHGEDVDDTFTVLIYTIKGVDPSQQLAVQYAGEVNYYLFNVG